MNKKTVNFTIPAKLSDFTQDTTKGNFSRGKLSVFYIGETEDHRLFTEEFSDELLPSLPYTPIVSYWDAEKEDFVGHATEQQILGIVDPCAETTFEVDEDGKKWAVHDVVLYTERPDTVGKLAQKIVGHKQSLELDPKVTKYKVNYDEKKHFKNIEFTAGRFVGVSVLGNDQKPAFTGSEFFSCNEEFELKMKILKDYCEGDNGQTEGGTDMNFSSNEFIKLSWGELALKVNEAVQKEYENDAWVSIVDCYNDSIVAHFYYYAEGSCKLMRVNYTADENGNITLGDIREVHVTYEDVEPKEPVQDNNQAFEDGDTGEGTEGDGNQTDPTGTQTDPAGTEPSNDGKQEGQGNESGDNTGETTGSNEGAGNEGGNTGGNEGGNTQVTEPQQESDPEDPADDEHIQGQPKKVEEYVDNAAPEAKQAEGQDFTVETTPEHEEQTAKASAEDETNSTENTGAASFTESERAELEALKKEKKINIVNSFAGQLDEEVIKELTSKIDDLTEDQVELECLRAFKAAQPITKKVRAFNTTLKTIETQQNQLADFIGKHLSK